MVVVVDAVVEVTAVVLSVLVGAGDMAETHKKGAYLKDVYLAICYEDQFHYIQLSITQKPENAVHREKINTDSPKIGAS